MEWQSGRKIGSKLTQEVSKLSDIVTSFGLPYNKLQEVFHKETDEIRKRAYALSISKRDEFALEHDPLFVSQVMDAVSLERLLWLAKIENPLVKAMAYDYVASYLPNGKINIQKETEPYQKIPKRRRRL